MYPHRAWDPGLDTQAGRRGYGQPQQGQQAQGQSASVSWQDQVRGNPAAEYAALMQARAADGAGGGVQGHVPFAGVKQTTSPPRTLNRTMTRTPMLTTRCRLSVVEVAG